MLRRALAIAALLTLNASPARASEEPATDGAAPRHGDHSQAHLVLAGLVSAAFLVFGAIAGGKGGARRSLRGGPASRSMRPSSNRPLQKS